jgi:hypothetical protein
MLGRKGVVDAYEIRGLGEKELFNFTKLLRRF